MSKERFVLFDRRRPAVCPGSGIHPLSAASIGCALCCLSASAEWDAEKYLVYGFGSLSLRPRLEVHETFDTNLFYQETNPDSDFITRVRPGLTLMLGKSGENSSSITYLTDIAEYAETDALDYIGHIVSHRAQFQQGRTTITGEDYLATSRSALGGTISYLRRPVGLLSLHDNWRINYEVSPKAILGLDLTHDYLDYEAADLTGSFLADFQTISGGLRAGYVFSERIVVYPQFTYRRTELFPNNPGARPPGVLSAYGVSLGAEGEFTPKLTGRIAGGYELREYSDGLPVPDGWIADASLRWQMRAKTMATLSFRHWITVAPDSLGTAYTGDRIAVSISQQFGTQGRWSATAEGYLQQHEYGDGFLLGGARVERADDMAGCTASTSYRWTPWLSTVADYLFGHYTDNIPGIPNYDVHRFTVRFVAGY